MRLRSEGGENTLENLITLCSAHHGAIHRAELIVEGTPSSGLRFWHADGRSYGALASPASSAMREKAWRALMQLGYRDAEAKHALAQVRADLNETIEGLVRTALRQLASGARRSAPFSRR